MKKLVVLLLALAMILSVFSGCAPAETTPTTPPDDGDKQTDNQGGADGEGVKDYGRIVIYPNHGGLDNNSAPATEEYITRMREYIKENTGVTVDYIVPPTDANESTQKLNMLIAGGEQFDCFKGNIATYSAQGALLPLDDLLEEYGPNIKALWPEDWAGGWAGMRTPDGVTYGIPELPGLAGYTIYLRTDVMEKLGVSEPKTLEEFEEILYKIRDEKPLGDETINLITDYAGMQMTFGAAYTGIGYDRRNVGYIDDEGKYMPYVFAPGYKDFLEKMAQWYKDGIIYKESFSINDDRKHELVKTNRVAASAYWYTRMTVGVDALQSQGMDIDLNPCSDLKGPKGYCRTMEDTSQVGWVIPRSSKNPEGVIRFIDWVQSAWENLHTVQGGFEGDTWKLIKADPENEVWQVESIPMDPRPYAGELCIGTSFKHTVQTQSINDRGVVPVDALYISDWITNNKVCQMLPTAGYTFNLDMTAIANELGPIQNDVKTYIESEVTKFVMGTRPMSEWETFLQELENVGLEKWSAAYTKEVEKYKK